MSKERLAAFSDAVIAIDITIMALELKVPHGSSVEVLRPLVPVFLSYLLSFINIAIYWNNHHHMFAVTEHVNGKILWADLHLLFWLSLFPFVTAWMGENHFAHVPTAVYGGVLLAASLAYWLLQQQIIASQGKHSLLASAVGSDIKGKLSPEIYLLAVLLAFVQTWLAAGLYVLGAMMWLLPDQRIERVVLHTESASGAQSEKAVTMPQEK